jgi:hypothetical protein
MTDSDYKKYTAQAKAAIKGEAFFEALISDYSVPHHIVGPKDVGIDYICEWAYGDKPTGILYAVQVKTISVRHTKLEYLGPKVRLNQLDEYKIKNPNLHIDERTLQYWRGLGMPIYLFAIIHSEPLGQAGQLDCYYKRFTPILTTTRSQEQEDFYKVNDGTAFLAFADRQVNKYGFARDLFIDLMRCSYSKGSISYISPRTIGLEQFPDENAVFVDLLTEYQEKVLMTYEKTRGFLEGILPNIQAVPSAASDE